MNYRTMLIEAHQRHQALDLPAPMSWLDHKNAMALKAWRERMAVAARGPVAPVRKWWMW